MKRLLLVSVEKTPQDQGKITDSARYGLAPELYNLPNLREAISRQGDFEIVTRHHTELAAAGEWDYVVLSGRFSPRDLSVGDEEYRALTDFIRDSTAPLLGICAGFHLISRAFGSEIVPMDDPAGEFGCREITVQCIHPLTQGLGERFTCMQFHRYTVSAVPKGFALLASAEKCFVQMIAHTERPIVGMQFHPELQNAVCRDGERLLQNFFQQY